MIKKTERGNFQYCFEGHIYNRHCSNKIRCQKKRFCPGMATYSDGVFNLLKNHTCKPNLGNVKAAIAKENFKNSVLEERDKSVSQIVLENLSRLDDGNSYLIVTYIYLS